MWDRMFRSSILCKGTDPIPHIEKQTDMSFDRYEFYKDMYEFELERMSTLNSAVNIPLTVLILLGSILGFFIKEYRFTNDALDWLFVSLMAITSG